MSCIISPLGKQSQFLALDLIPCYCISLLPELINAFYFSFVSHTNLCGTHLILVTLLLNFKTYF